MLDLALQQMALRDGLSALITLPTPPRETVLDMARGHDALTVSALPGDHPDSVAAFLDHWRPDCCIWVWGDLRPNLILDAARRGVPLMLVAAETAGFEGRRDRWLPDVLRRLLQLFMSVMVCSSAMVARFTQLGLAREDIVLSSPLQAGSRALPCNETDETELATACVGRPLWFANAVEAAEMPTVLAAHRQALRLSHRLMLVLRPADGLSGAQALAQCTAQDFRTVDWDSGQFPDESTQVLIFENQAERGLFYRLAPVCFLGGSLVPSTHACDPLEAAALGSAVLYGPRVGRYLQSYSRLVNAGAARIINDGTALGTAVSQLVAPDQAAMMARAGWEVVSEGAALADRISDLVQDTLDKRASRT